MSVIHCMLCDIDVDTDYNATTGYIEGVGDVCVDCLEDYNKEEKK